MVTSRVGRRGYLYWLIIDSGDPPFVFKKNLVDKVQVTTMNLTLSYSLSNRRCVYES